MNKLSILILICLIHFSAALTAGNFWESDDLYERLQVQATASQEEIKKAYRNLSLKYHPDRNGDVEDFSDLPFKAIGESYRILSDIDERKKYDFGRQWEEEENARMREKKARMQEEERQAALHKLLFERVYFRDVMNLQREVLNYFQEKIPGFNLTPDESDFSNRANQALVGISPHPCHEYRVCIIRKGKIYCSNCLGEDRRISDVVYSSDNFDFGHHNRFRIRKETFRLSTAVVPNSGFIKKKTIVCSRYLGNVFVGYAPDLCERIVSRLRSGETTTHSFDQKSNMGIFDVIFISAVEKDSYLRFFSVASSMIRDEDDELFGNRDLTQYDNLKVWIAKDELKDVFKCLFN